MQTTVIPRAGACFRWNAGAWFGSSIGGTSWMAITAGILVIYRQPWLAAIIAGCFFSTNVVAWALWTRRDRLDPFRAEMVLLGCMAITVPAAWLSAALGASADALAAMNWPTASVWNFIVSIVVPAMMAWFYLLDHQARRRRTRQDVEPSPSTSQIMRP